MCLVSDSHEGKSQAQVPLCVDLDGTLIKCDMFWVSLSALLKRNILYLPILPIWLLKGKAFVKGQISSRVTLDPTILPYHRSLLDFIRVERKTGRTVILATGTHYRIANTIAQHLNCFDHVLATSDLTNLTGKRKSQALVKRYGKGGFDYVGNSHVDLFIWENAKRAIVVNGSKNLVAAVKKVTEIQTIFP